MREPLRRIVTRIVFRLTAVCLGLAMAFLIAEVSYRFYLFGWRLSYAQTQFVDPSAFEADKPLVAFLGDSFTRGYPFPIDQSYPLLLAGSLADDRIRVGNFGRTGSSLRDVILTARQVAALDPDLVVWGLSTNDAIASAEALRESRYWNEATGEPQPLGDPPRSAWYYLVHALWILPYDSLVNAKMSLFSTVKEVLQTYSYVYVVVKSALDEHRLLGGFRAPMDEFPERREMVEESLHAYRRGNTPASASEAIGTIHEGLHAQGIAFIVLYLPQESELNASMFRGNLESLGVAPDDYDRSNPRVQLRRFCESRGIPFIDPSEAMEQEVRQGRRLFLTFDRHYNRTGNAWLADFLSRNRLLTEEIGRLTRDGARRPRDGSTAADSAATARNRGQSRAAVPHSLRRPDGASRAHARTARRETCCNALKNQAGDPSHSPSAHRGTRFQAGRRIPSFRAARQPAAADPETPAVERPS